MVRLFTHGVMVHNRVIFIVQFPMYVITKLHVSWQFDNMRLAVVRVHNFLLALVVHFFVTSSNNICIPSPLKCC